MDLLREQRAHVLFELFASVRGEDLHLLFCDDDIITVCLHLIVACLSDAFVCDVVLVKLYVFEKTHKRKNVCMFIIYGT